MLSELNTPTPAIELKPGDTFLHTVLLNFNETGIDSLDGVTVKSQLLKESPRGRQLIHDLDIEAFECVDLVEDDGGVTRFDAAVQLSLSAKLTNSLAIGRYVVDVQLTRDNDQVVESTSDIFINVIKDGTK